MNFCSLQILIVSDQVLVQNFKSLFCNKQHKKCRKLFPIDLKKLSTRTASTRLTNLNQKKEGKKEHKVIQ